ncbi:hypothetical protein ACFRKC_38545, partial [Streptomyces chartreusis]
REQIDDTEFATSGSASGAGDSSESGGSSASADAPPPDGAADAGEAGDRGSDSGSTSDSSAGSDSGASAGAHPQPTNTEQGETGESGHAKKQGGHSGILRVLAEARAYVESPPPLGRVRSSFAPGDARTLRADGPGWSLVARTDDIAFVLLDDEPGEVLPVGRGPELPGLLEALDKMAVRPL